MESIANRKEMLIVRMNRVLYFAILELVRHATNWSRLNVIVQKQLRMSLVRLRKGQNLAAKMNVKNFLTVKIIHVKMSATKDHANLVQKKKSKLVTVVVIKRISSVVRKNSHVKNHVTNN